MPKDINEKRDSGIPGRWNNILHDEFEKESDRAAGILVASLLDDALVSLIRNSLVPNPCREDELFDSPNAPLSTFSSRISFAHRLGLVSRKLSRDLHLIRKIRNIFAHDVQGCTFENGAVQSRIDELLKSSGFKERHPKKRAGMGDVGPRLDFLLCASWMLFAIHQEAESCEARNDAKDEWGYDKELSEDTRDKTEEAP